MLQRQAGYLGSGELAVTVRDKCVRRAGVIVFHSKPEAVAAVEYWRKNVANVIEPGIQTDQRRNPWWFCAKSGQPLLIVVYDGMVVWASDIVFGTPYEKVEGKLWKAVEKIHSSVVPDGVQAPPATQPDIGAGTSASQPAAASKNPTTEIQKGKVEAWFLDWDFCTDNSNGSRVEKAGLKEGHIYFHGLFDERGWIKELRYYDRDWKHRWTKVFSYPAESTTGGTFLPHSYKYLTPEGQEIDSRKREQAVKAKAGGWRQGTPKERLREALGEPLVITTGAFGDETWIYFDGINQHRYPFSKGGQLDYGYYDE
ncbi:MAG: hypothetical protein NTV86_05205 [Planctomycetota bacterium]|nr:hypothetical protein [Planctomycetota bacterium]